MKQLKCVILDGENYFSWQAQFSALLRGYRLLEYVEGKIPLPEGSPAEQQDQIILSWILTAVSSPILSQIAALTTSHKVWECLKQLHSSDSETRLLHLRMQLQNCRKGSLSMSQYLRGISIAKDKLASAGERIRDSQIILTTLGGLGPEYKQFVTSITTRFDHSMSFTQLQQLLMDYELSEEQTATVEAHLVNKPYKEKSGGPRSHPCQICSRKGIPQSTVLTERISSDFHLLITGSWFLLVSEAPIRHQPT